MDPCAAAAAVVRRGEGDTRRAARSGRELQRLIVCSAWLGRKGCRPVGAERGVRRHLEATEYVDRVRIWQAAYCQVGAPLNADESELGGSDAICRQRQLGVYRRLRRSRAGGEESERHVQHRLAGRVAEGEDALSAHCEGRIPLRQRAERHHGGVGRRGRGHCVVASGPRPTLWCPRNLFYDNLFTCAHGPRAYSCELNAEGARRARRRATTRAPRARLAKTRGRARGRARGPDQGARLDPCAHQQQACKRPHADRTRKTKSHIAYDACGASRDREHARGARDFFLGCCVLAVPVAVLALGSPSRSVCVDCTRTHARTGPCSRS